MSSVRETFRTQSVVVAESEGQTCAGREATSWMTRLWEDSCPSDGADIEKILSVVAGR